MADKQTPTGIDATLDRTSLQEPLLTQPQQLDDGRDGSVIEKDVALPPWLLCRCRDNGEISLVRVNHNVLLNLVICVVYGVADSLWAGTVIAAYLKRLGHNQNSPVGDVEAASGLANLVSALPVGYVADKVGRAKVVRGGGVLLAVTALLHVWLLQWIGVNDDPASSHPHAFEYMGVIMALWGIAGGVVNGPAQALYADSTPAGNRSTYYMYLFAAYVLSSCVGPLVSIVLFQTLGDEWDLYHLRIVLYVGIGLEAVNAFLMMFFDDRKALDENEDEPNGAPTEDDSNDATLDEEQQRIEPPRNGTQEQVSTTEELDDVVRRRKYIPYIIFCQAFVFSIGSGMTVKFFPLFFKDEVGMSPTQVQIIYVLVPITMAALSGVGQALAKTGFGRVQSALALNTSGVACLFSMVLFKKYLDVHPFALVPVYVLRTSLMNCTYPLQESILMDFVPKNERARWKSLDSIAVFGWCGSAALGGWLTDKYDYTYTFFITALIQSLGILCFSLLLPLVPRREEDLASPAANAVQGNNATQAVEPITDNGDPLRESQTEKEKSTLNELDEPLLENGNG